MLPLFDAQCTVHTLLFNLLHKARTSSYIQESTSKERVSLFLYSRSKYPFFTPLKYRTSASMKFIYISLKRTHLSRTGLKKGWLCLKQVPKKGRIVLSNKWPPKAQWSQTGFLLYTCTVQSVHCAILQFVSNINFWVGGRFISKIRQLAVGRRGCWQGDDARQWRPLQSLLSGDGGGRL